MAQTFSRKIDTDNDQINTAGFESFSATTQEYNYSSRRMTNNTPIINNTQPSSKTNSRRTTNTKIQKISSESIPTYQFKTQYQFLVNKEQLNQCKNHIEQLYTQVLMQKEKIQQVLQLKTQKYLDLSSLQQIQLKLEIIKYQMVYYKLLEELTQKQQTNAVKTIQSILERNENDNYQILDSIQQTKEQIIVQKLENDALRFEIEQQNQQILIQSFIIGQNQAKNVQKVQFTNIDTLSPTLEKHTHVRNQSSNNSFWNLPEQSQ